MRQLREASIGDWVHLLHSVLRRKARCDDATPRDRRPRHDRGLPDEVERFQSASSRLPRVTGIYV